MVSINFDPQAHEPMKDYTPIPPGEYLCMIVDSERKENSKRTGYYLELTFSVIEGECKGRCLRARLNLNNPNAQTVEIAQQELATICNAVGVKGQVPDSVQLHNIPLMVRIEVREWTNDQGKTKQTNVPTWYEPAKRVEPAAPASTGSPTADAQWVSEKQEPEIQNTDDIPF